MTSGRSREKPFLRDPATLLALAAGLALYAPNLRLELLGDDFLFLNHAKSQPIGQWIWTTGGVPFYRPLSRQLYFEVMNALFGSNPLPYHVVNLALLLGVGALLALLVRRLVSPAAGTVTALLFLAQHGASVLTGWASCAQDLWALGFIALALVLQQRGRAGWAAACVGLGLMSKETAALAPPLLTLVEFNRSRGGVSTALRGSAWAYAVAGAWAAAYAIWFRHFPGEIHGTRMLDVAIGPASVTTGLVRELGAVANLDAGFSLDLGPADFTRMFAAVALGVTAVLLARPAPAQSRGTALAIGALWAAIAIPALLLVAHRWNTYHTAILGAGLAVFLGACIGRHRWISAPLVAAMLAAGPLADARTGGLQEAELDSFTSLARLHRVSAYVGGLREHLRKHHPSLAPRSTIVVTRTSPMSLFALEDGDAVRVWYGDTTLRVQELGQCLAEGRPIGGIVSLDYVYEPPVAEWREEGARFTALRIEDVRLRDGSQYRAAAAVDRELISMPEFANWTPRMQAEYWIGLAELETAIPDLAAAESGFKRSLELSSELPRAWSGLARVITLRGRLEEGMSVLEQGARAFPEDPIIAYMRGVARIYTGNVSEGARLLRRSLDLGLQEPMRADAVQALRKSEG